MGIICILLLLFLPQRTGYCQDNCFTVIVGKKASKDGTVLLAHNEDNGITEISRMVRKPGGIRSPKRVFLPESAGRYSDSSSLAYWSLEIPSQSFSDVLCNERGIVIVSNGCPSREENGEIADGGVGRGLRHFIAEYAVSARDGVIKAGMLVERFGYNDSGRTLVICDSREGWVVCLVRGRHWVAARVPDTHVAVIANSYSIRHIDLSDSANFLGSRDVIAYAASRKWYDPSMKNFSFEKAYAGEKDRTLPVNLHRQWRGYRLLIHDMAETPDIDTLPFSVKPEKPVTLQSLYTVMRDHYEHTPYESGPGEHPHHGEYRTICHETTNSSSIFELRTRVSPETAVVWRLALWHPCISPYVILYPNLFPDMDRIPAALVIDETMMTAKLEYASQVRVDRLIRASGDLTQFVNADYRKNAPASRLFRENFESSNDSGRSIVEKQFETLRKKNPRLARSLLYRFCLGGIAEAMALMEKHRE